MRQAQRRFSVEEYLALEEASGERHEYYQGEIFAMSGGSLEHNQIALNLRDSLRSLTERGCRTYVSDVRAKTPSGLFTYPDVLVVCGRPQFTADRHRSLTNPVVIAEVLSESTRDYDRGERFELYRAIPTLRDYLLIDQYSIDLEHRFLGGDRWESRRYTKREDAFRLAGVYVEFHVGALYDLVELTQ
jgi:Uma2 family endonuclease